MDSIAHLLAELAREVFLSQYALSLVSCSSLLCCCKEIFYFLRLCYQVLAMPGPDLILSLLEVYITTYRRKSENGRKPAGAFSRNPRFRTHPTDKHIARPSRLAQPPAVVACSLRNVCFNTRPKPSFKMNSFAMRMHR